MTPCVNEVNTAQEVHSRWGVPAPSLGPAVSPLWPSNLAGPRGRRLYETRKGAIKEGFPEEVRCSQELKPK